MFICKEEQFCKQTIYECKKNAGRSLYRDVGDGHDQLQGRRPYVDTVNAEKMIQTGVEGMLSLTDPYTEYYPEEEVSSLKEMTTGKYGGIGAAIRYYEAKDRIAVVEPTEGMPAAEAGVKAGDIILSVGGKEMVRGDMKPQEFSSKVSEALRGEPGTSFVLKVLRPLKNDSTVMEFKITRKNIRTNPVPYYGMVKDSIGYLALSSFTENSAKDFKKAFIERFPS